MKTQYLGVYYRPRDDIFEARIFVDNRRVHLKTYRDAETAARVRDIAARWLLTTHARFNFSERIVPEGITERLIARWLVEGGVSLRLLARRLPLSTLIEAGVAETDLLGAGVPIQRLLDARQNTAS